MLVVAGQLARLGSEHRPDRLTAGPEVVQIFYKGDHYQFHYLLIAGAGRVLDEPNNPSNLPFAAVRFELVGQVSDKLTEGDVRKLRIFRFESRNPLLKPAADIVVGDGFVPHLTYRRARFSGRRL